MEGGWGNKMRMMMANDRAKCKSFTQPKKWKKKCQLEKSLWWGKNCEPKVDNYDEDRNKLYTLVMSRRLAPSFSPGAGTKQLSCHWERHCELRLKLKCWKFCVFIATLSVLPLLKYFISHLTNYEVQSARRGAVCVPLVNNLFLKCESTAS